MRITAIKAQVKNTERVSVYLDGKYSFSLTQNQLLELKIHSGMELTEQELEDLKKASDYGKLLGRSMEYVMIRPRSIREVRDYLWRKKADPEMAEKIIEKLLSRNYLGDAAFARSWVRARQLTKPVSKRRLTAELIQKGVANDLIQQALGGDDPDDAYDEAEALRSIITKKRKQARYQDEQKLMQYLARQGFSYDLIKSTLAGNNE
jgi:regulatory protein